MITNKGKQVITKYMLGQAPEYAAYIAVGVGPKPLLISESDNSSPTKESMDFEAFRVPILSKGLVNDTISIDIESWQASSNLITVTTSTNHGINIGDAIDISFSASADNSKEGTFSVLSTTSNTIQYSQTIGNSSWSASGSYTGTVTYVKERLVFKAQLPPDQQYQMTEIALYPAANNQLAIGYDSRPIAGFLTTEGWIRHTTVDNDIDFVTQSIVDAYGNVSASVINDAAFINSNNQAFDFTERKERLESPRFLNRSLIIKGDTSAFLNDNLDVSSSTNYIYTANLPLDLSKNSPNDLIKIALSVIAPEITSPTIPNKIRFRLDFIDSSTGGKATAGKIFLASDITQSRYQIISKEIANFEADSNFSWARIGQIKIYAESLTSGGSYDGSYISLDGIRIDNIKTQNPLYSMIAYSIIKNSTDDGLPIKKSENSQAYIEYRIGTSVY